LLLNSQSGGGIEELADTSSENLSHVPRVFIGGTSGKIFSGEVIRTFPEKAFLFDFPPNPENSEVWPEPKSKDCENWAVVTTIFALSESMQRTLALGPKWCTVVVADKKTPLASYSVLPKNMPRDWVDRLVLFTVEEQETLASTSQYVAAIPWNHFGRKNVGFLFAAKHKAKMIFDFDDDNILIDVPAASPSRNSALSVEVPEGFAAFNPAQGLGSALEAPGAGRWLLSPEPKKTESGLVPYARVEAEEGRSVAAAAAGNAHLFNPYPSMGSTSPEAWPRGFPLDAVTDPATFEAAKTSSGGDLSASGAASLVGAKFEDVAVWQSLADHDPDVDALYRLTKRQIHFDFIGPTAAAAGQPFAVALPKGVLCPYNAQATTHFPGAFFGALLPTTVPGRVSDIWRSYITQRLLWDVGQRIAFTMPVVAQERVAHNFMADMDAERDLYFKATALAKFLNAWALPGDDGSVVAEEAAEGVGGSAAKHDRHLREAQAEQSKATQAEQIEAEVASALFPALHSFSSDGLAETRDLQQQQQQQQMRRRASTTTAKIFADAARASAHERAHKRSLAARTLPGRMEQLYVDLYERSYVELEDVKAVQLWLQALADVGYEFPTVVVGKPSTRHHA